MAATSSPDPATLEGLKDRQWYHTIELAPGVCTPGYFDTRKVAPKLPMPASLAGKRCLDVGTFDGFWGFEMERRGAAEVIAVDENNPEGWDWPVGSSESVAAAFVQRKREGSGFEIAHQALGSGVQRLDCNVYDLSPERVGTFDFVYLGSILLHLRDPVLALQRVASVCRGQLLSVDAVDFGLSLRQPRRPIAGLDGLGRPWWWKPNIAGLKRMVEVGGFRVVQGPRPFLMPAGEGLRRPSWKLAAHKGGREQLTQAIVGDPHAYVLAEPRVPAR